MPWWGWLIAGCVALVVVGWVTVALVGIRTTARAMREQSDAFDRRRRRGGYL